MIAVDSCVIIDFFDENHGPHTQYFLENLTKNQAILPPPVIAELASDAKRSLSQFGLDLLPVLVVENGYWLRAGLLRAKLRQHGLKAALGDALIAQSCIDHDVPLLTRDTDFRHYAKHGGLKLAKP